MSKKTFVVVMGLALVAVLTAGGLLASNMGFKLNYSLRGNGVDSYLTNENTLALPFNQQSGMVDAGDLCRDIGWNTIATDIQRWNPKGPGRETYTCGKAFGLNFPIAAGEGYFVIMKSGASKDYITVGSHDPAKSITLNGNGVGGWLTNENVYGVPYHTTAQDAGDLCREIGWNTVATDIQRWNPKGPGRETYTCGKAFGLNFPLKPGEPTFVIMKSGQTSTFTPAHY